MATTINQAFEELKTNLEITGLQQSTVSIRQQNVRAAVEDELEVLDSFLTGSYSRHTMIAPLKESDIDIFTILAPKYFHHFNGQNGGQAGLLDLVKRVLKNTYPKTPDISRNGQAVTIQFTDFKVDVVPAFTRKGGGYLMPNSISQTWISTDPKKHVEIMSEANKAHDGDLVPLVKMIKAWNKIISSFFTSFHLEVMVLQILNNITISNFPSGVRYFFDKGRNYVKQKNPDPTGYNEDVGSYLNTQERINDAVSRFETAYERAIEAEELNRKSYTEDAIDTWKKIFDDYFPSYG